ncbi:transcriptional regulator [Photobacterium sp. NCIMB 13483]|uniref:WYL domain-containing protein n=1 Tax=Photobacterium sp. NCIMB 13483 TaxID=2022103 RepID=UPI000D1775C6|nr:WYL domain-containing protein [Photobacterium sp. NCIMB 13483]PST85346.1 transcriptional regulator [Photobacterium sp. NCIMB 13483]
MNEMTFLQLQNEDKNADRMAYIDFKIRFTGFINRSDLTSMFGLASAAASNMMAKYLELRPENMEYDPKLRANVITNKYKPLVNIDADTALGMLANGFNKNKLIDNPIVPYARIGYIDNPLDTDAIAKITRAMARGYAISTKYYSKSSGDYSKRTILPTALLFNGKDWIFRAFCKKNKELGKFKFFNFARALKVEEEFEHLRTSQEDISQDKMWNTMIPLLLIPHQDRTESEVNIIKYDFGFHGESKLIKTERAAFIFMLKHQWLIDDRTDEKKEKDIKNNCKPYYNFELSNKDMVTILLESLDT